MKSLPNVFGKQTLSHSSSVLKLTLFDGPSWQSYFSDGAFSQYKGFFSPETKAFLPDTKTFLPVPQFWKVLDVLCWCPHQSNGTKGCNSRAHNPCKPCQSVLFPIDHLQQACWFPFNLAILNHWSKNVFWRQRCLFFSNDQNKCCSRQKPKR